MWQKENIRKFHYFLYEFSMIAYLGKMSTNTTIKSCMCFVGIISRCKRYKDSTLISYIPKSRFSWHYNCDSKSFFLVDMIVRARQILTITLTIQSLRTQSSSVPMYIRQLRDDDRKWNKWSLRSQEGGTRVNLSVVEKELYGRPYQYELYILSRTLGPSMSNDPI